MSKFKILKAATLSLLLAACGSESGVNKTNNSGGGKELSGVSGEPRGGVAFEAYATIPIQKATILSGKAPKRTSSNYPTYTVMLNNYTGESYTIDAINFVKSDGSKISEGFESYNEVALKDRKVVNGDSIHPVMIRPTAAEDMVLEAELINRANPKEKFTVRQFIRVSDLITSGDGVFLMKDDVKEIIVSKNNPNYSYVVSMTLLQDIDGIKTDNGTLTCPNSKLSANTVCTLRIAGEATSNLHKVEAVVTAIKGSEKYQQNISTLVRTATTPYILMSHSAEINLTQGVESAKVTLYNSGTLTAENLEFSTNGNLIIDNPESCKNIVSGGICSLSLSLKDTPPDYNTIDYIQVQYKNLEGKLISNSSLVRIIVGENKPQLIFSTDDSLENVVVGKTKQVKLTVTNGGIDLTGFSVSLNDPLITIQNNTCLENARFIKKTSCSLELVYSPNKAENARMVLLGAKAQYVDEAGIVGTPLDDFYPIKLSAFVPGSTIEPDPNPKDPKDPTKPIVQESGVTVTKDGAVIKIIGNKIDTKTAILAIKNTSSATTVIKNITLPDNDKGKLQLVELEKSCSNKTLELGDTCLIKVKYGPTGESPTEKNFGIKVDYEVVSIPSSLTLPVKVIIGEFAEVRATLSVSGAIQDPNNTNNYSIVIGKTTDRAILTYTFINNGNAPQLLMNENILKSQADYNKSSTCSDTGKNLLGAGESCTFVLNVPSDEMLKKRATTASSIPGYDKGTIVDPLPNAQYTNVDGSLTKVLGTTVSLDYNRIWINPSYTFSLVSITENLNKKSWKVSIKVEKGTNDTLSGAVIFMPNSNQPESKIDPLYRAVVTPCTLDIGVDSCTAIVEFPSAHFDTEFQRKDMRSLFMLISQFGYYDIQTRVGIFSLESAQ